MGLLGGKTGGRVGLFELGPERVAALTGWGGPAHLPTKSAIPPPGQACCTTQPVCLLTAFSAESGHVTESAIGKLTLDLSLLISRFDLLLDHSLLLPSARLGWSSAQ